MKTRIKIVLVMLSVAFFSATAYAEIQNGVNNPKVIENNNQDTKITGVYQGHFDSGYNFTVINKKGVEEITKFSKIDEALAKSNDLDSKSVVGTTFEISGSSIFRWSFFCFIVC